MGADGDDGGRPARRRPLQTFSRLPERERIVVAAAAMVVMIAFGVLLLPFGVDVDGAAVQCGSALTPVQMDAGDPAAQACSDAASTRQIAAGVVVVIAVAAAFVIRSRMSRPDADDVGT
ncbi:MAG: hypothetical protein K1X95_15535 [Acidimicrobiia bacterium]|nr:hypothetical protein [Acidimicrobiia bacterium]